MNFNIFNGLIFYLGDVDRWLDAYLALNSQLTNKDGQKEHFEMISKLKGLKWKLSNLRG